MWTDRTEALVGKDGLQKLKNSRVCIVGIGGVGGHTCLMLARAGIENITLVDFDKVDETNINRQAVANVETVGKLKTEVMREMILKINPNCKVEVFSERFCAEMAERLFANGFDYVVDAIDSVQDKVDLVCFCKENNINIVSAMGAGNRIGIPEFAVVDIYKTSYDGLAKVMRKKMKERGVSALDVVSTKEPAAKLDNFVGSISYYPAMCGCVLGAFVVNKLLETNK